MMVTYYINEQVWFHNNKQVFNSIRLSLYSYLVVGEQVVSMNGHLKKEKKKKKTFTDNKRFIFFYISKQKITDAIYMKNQDTFHP